MSSLTMSADHAELRQLRSWIAGTAAGLDAQQLGRIELCIHELASNVIDHSGVDEFHLEATMTRGRLQISIRDAGAPVKVATSELEPHPRVRGYGLMIADQLASELDYRRHRGRNIWTASFDLDVRN